MVHRPFIYVAEFEQKTRRYEGAFCGSSSGEQKGGGRVEKSWKKQQKTVDIIRKGQLQ
jgi:hypothetical protein